MDPKAERKRKLLAEAAKVHQGTGRKTETHDEQRRRMAAQLLAVADASVASAAKGSDPVKVSVALANATKALELAERLNPTQATSAGHTVVVQMPQDDDADGDDAAADPQSQIQ